MANCLNTHTQTYEVWYVYDMRYELRSRSRVTVFFIFQEKILSNVSSLSFEIDKDILRKKGFLRAANRKARCHISIPQLRKIQMVIL